MDTIEYKEFKNKVELNEFFRTNNITPINLSFFNRKVDVSTPGCTGTIEIMCYDCVKMWYIQHPKDSGIPCEYFPPGHRQ